MSSETNLEALVIHPDGSHGQVSIPRSDELRTLQGIVGGYIEAVYGAGPTPNPMSGEYDNVTFFCNDEGKIQAQPRNDLATALWWALNPDARGVDHLCGAVVVTGGADRNGDTLSVPAKVVEMVGQAGA